MIPLSTMHQRVVRVYGKAKEYDCVECGKQAHDWANIHGRDRDLIDSYQPMCKSCHGYYDNGFLSRERAKRFDKLVADQRERLARTGTREVD